MNSVILIGRLTRDPEVRYTSNSLAVAKFSVAIDRYTKPGEEKQADFPRITVFGKTAENCERFLTKGKLVGVQGRIQTGSYQDKDGKTVYTTDVVAGRIEFLEWGEKKMGSQEDSFEKSAPSMSPESTPEGFAALDDEDEDIPF